MAIEIAASPPRAQQLVDAASRAWAIFVRDARLARSYPISFSLQWIGIAVEVAAFYFISKLVAPSSAFGFSGRPLSYFDYVVVNLAFVRFQSTAIQCFQQAIRGDQMLGTLEIILATPTGLPLIVLSASLWAFTLTALQVVLFLALGLFLGLDLSRTNLVTAVVFILLTVASMSPLGVLGAASIMTFKQAGPTNFIMGGAATLLGGVLFPVSKLPVALQLVSWFLPITHALKGIRSAAQGASLAQVAPDAIWLGVAALTLLPVSLMVFNRAVKRAKIDGTLGQY
jgi:ABC-2 type transport system permease protein